MRIEDFIARHAKLITALWKGVPKHYGVTEHEFAERLAAIAVRSGEAEGDAKDFLNGVKAEELCLAVACENGDSAAWEKFETEYRHSMQAAARALTKDDAEAEDVVQFVYGELFGIRTDGDRRISKLAHYSGRGSLGGWLRAVVYQCFIDRKRQTSRFEQIEEASEFERLANHAAHNGNGSLQVHLPAPDDIEDTRLRRATEEAMTKAIAELDPRDRLMLNYYYFDDLTLREIGLLMNVHEATISRWLAKAQREVKRKTEEILQRSYGLRRAEVTECLHIAARTELDVRKLLADVKSVAAERAP
ncbi:MAG TPA: sigma-70 family RNA polymerase sigma factor [Blastocatellia bacterium]|nr:sigma-70 family RNA polymerase sigma factor [Blastocatellia bacterium]HMX28946.1 sigma-70 family RNA polymerase sigma factor [Blastocatellia bacterium]HMZ20321.1 sigma-70 family RNA polymerase sigma factor [Blastocatellia bacterium]HNG29711.1 sigma-70 family RNA polymerase sigma factor [Blastocatellia bacterium]